MRYRTDDLTEYVGFERVSDWVGRLPDDVEDTGNLYIECAPGRVMSLWRIDSMTEFGIFWSSYYQGDAVLKHIRIEDARTFRAS